MPRPATWFWVFLSGILLFSRIAHRNILWADEDYHLAAGIQLLHGKMLYRDLWYDKPPLSALLTLLFGAWAGWPLRIAGTLLAAGACAAAFRFASQLWSRREGFCAAGLLGFFLVFYLPSATIPLEPDTWMILPHAAAVYLAWSRRPLAAGVAAGLAFSLNIKGLLVLVAGRCCWPDSCCPTRWCSPGCSGSMRSRPISKASGAGGCCTPARPPAIRLSTAHCCACATGSDFTRR
jgi:4-amino-4-deoxy-L-arabinose transferase-like glycosyltransferase